MKLKKTRWLVIWIGFKIMIKMKRNEIIIEKNVH